jgi:RNA polymerase sigma-70 factor, ECF subfamily
MDVGSPVTTPARAPAASGTRAGGELPAGLRGTGPRQERAERELRALLLAAVRFEMQRRAAVDESARRDEADELAVRVADDACATVIGSLEHYRAQSRFATWAAKYALHAAAVRLENPPA